MLNQSITTNEAAHLLLNDDNAGWTYEGANAIAEYLYNLSDYTDEPLEFDVVAIRCDYSECSLEDLVDAYGHLYPRNIPSDLQWLECCDEAMDEFHQFLIDNTHCFIELNNGNYIVGDF